MSRVSGPIFLTLTLRLQRDDLWALCAGIVQRTEKRAAPEALHRPNWSGPPQRYATPDLTWVPCQETMVTSRGRFVALMGSK